MEWMPRQALCSLVFLGTQCSIVLGFTLQSVWKSVSKMHYGLEMFPIARICKFMISILWDVWRGLSKERGKPADEKVGDIKGTANSFIWCKWEEKDGERWSGRHKKDEIMKSLFCHPREFGLYPNDHGEPWEILGGKVSRSALTSALSGLGVSPQSKRLRINSWFGHLRGLWAQQGIYKRQLIIVSLSQPCFFLSFSSLPLSLKKCLSRSDLYLEVLLIVLLKDWLEVGKTGERKAI